MKKDGKLRIMLADDHSVVRNGLRAIISSEKDMELVGEVEDGSEVVEKAREVQPDVILMDITMPGLGGLEATRLVKAAMPEVKVLILTIHESEECLYHALNIGADGYLTKAAHESELILAIRALARDKCYIDPSMASLLVSAFVSGGNGAPPRSADTDRYKSLTEREKEMLPLIASGQTNKEIAHALHLSEHTVHNHRAHLMEKLGIHDRVQLLMYAIRRGIISTSQA
jgi:two-component system response regulator NreC